MQGSKINLAANSVLCLSSEEMLYEHYYTWRPAKYKAELKTDLEPLSQNDFVSMNFFYSNFTWNNRKKNGSRAYFELTLF